MKLRAGYKNTEIGVIPVDWEIVTLDELTYKIGDGIHSTPQYSSDGEYFFINGNNLTDGKIVILKETKKVSKEEFLIHKKVLSISTILLSINGTIGNIAFYNNEKIILGKSAAYINLNEKIEKELLYQLLQTKFIEKYFNDELTGSTIKNLGLGSIRNTPVPLPPLSEQKAIAQVLSDTDNLIQSLEKLINKKRLIKQGAMQKLFTPKDDWEIKKLGEICDVRDGTHQTPNYVEIGIPFYSVENVTKNDFKNTKFISESEHNFLTKNWKIEKGDILMTRIGSIGDCKFINWNVNASFYVSLALLKMKKGFSGQFLTQYSNSEFFKKEIELNSLSSAIPKKINLGQISNVKVIIPLNYEEQTHIATILSDMDSEIEALEKKQAKYKQLKQGLMQNLLTGKIRLV